jgi:hypothetical protein
MSQALRLSEQSAVISDSLYFERRKHPRRRARGQVTAVIREPGADRDDPAKMLTLDLVDISDSGVGMASTQPIAVGSRITVFFPPHGPEPGFDLIGEVVRCVSVDDHHTIGVALQETKKQAG